MKNCKVCKQQFDPATPLDDPAMQAGIFMAQQGEWNDVGELCPRCLASRGLLGMMYCREYDA
ncbi:hypothetical protein [Geoalkalibacter halelectricus]|uniref:Uncharacterized protein n=1 Tax=Geoalkalibacter halelectricus TaxID=2847045 RepID=A0ABY5ZSF3_9BACT|nr:hypothetical protein [Geoalkalibacter halelectricus]MDO3377363.1 hypothetical protein [Geoalkalibacter halelectricus]UWZ80872.1 hypothetical protein L9S41_05575 [Geoalkalibacter halelectricus]